MLSLCRRLLIGLASALLLSSCAKKDDPAGAAKHFFELLAAGKASQAYADAAFGFQAQQTEKSFLQTAREMELTTQDGLEWEAPEIVDKEATVRVRLTGKDGQVQPFIVTLVQESGAWRIYSLRSPRGSGTRTENRFTLVGKGAAFSDAQSQRLPDDAEIRKMVVRTLGEFDEAVQKKSFTEFYSRVSAAWQKQLTVGQLERAFQPFVNAGVRFGGLTETEMVLDGPPAISTEGVLVINGHFPTTPFRIHFTMKFVYQLPSWKLFGLDVNLQQ